MPIVLPAIIPGWPLPTVRGPIQKVAYNGWETGDSTLTHLREIKGLDDMADLRTGDADLPGLDGVLFGTDEEGKKVIELTFITYAKGALNTTDEQDQVSLAATELVAAFQRRRDDVLPLDIHFENGDGEQTVSSIYCRPRKRVLSHKIQAAQVYFESTVTLEAPDPRVYGPQQTNTVGMALGAGGRSYPRIYPYTYGVLGSGGTITVENDGSRESFPVAYVYGPVTNPVVENVTQGKQIKVLLTLIPGDFLTIDFWNRTIVLNDQASRYYAITGQSAWWYLDPGTSLVRFSGGFFESSARLTLNWRSAS